MKDCCSTETGSASACPAGVDASCRVPLLAAGVLAATWAGLGSLLALLASVKFHGPSILAGHPWLTYGRVYPAAWHALFYGFAAQAGIGLTLWISARLARVNLAGAPVASAGVLLWNLGVATAVVGILAGRSSGFDGFEMPAAAAVILFVGYGAVGGSTVLTFSRRTSCATYASQWFFLAAVFWFPWVISTATLVLHSLATRGAYQHVIQSWFGGNVLWVWLNLVSAGALTYFLPKLSGAALHSRQMVLVGFWGTLAFQTWSCVPSGSPVPAWIPSVGVLGALLSLVPLLSNAINWRLTIRGQEASVQQHEGGRFLLFASVAYLISGLAHVLVCYRPVGEVLQLSMFGDADRLFAVLGVAGMTGLGGLHYALARVSGGPLKQAGLQFALAAGGVVLLCGSLAAGGILQGTAQSDGAVAFVETLKRAVPMLRLSTMGWVMLTAAAWLFWFHAVGSVCRMVAACCPGLPGHQSQVVKGRVNPSMA